VLKQILRLKYLQLKHLLTYIHTYIALYWCTRWQCLRTGLCSKYSTVLDRCIRRHKQMQLLLSIVVKARQSMQWLIRWYSGAEEQSGERTTELVSVGKFD